MLSLNGREFIEKVNISFRVCTERALLKSLREWDQYAWWEDQYLRKRVRKNWDTMFSVVEKLTGMEEGC